MYRIQTFFFFYIYKAPYYGVPFSHLSPELQIYPIQLEISTNLPI